MASTPISWLISSWRLLEPSLPPPIITLGTGACAAAVAAISQGWMDSPLQIELPGGKLSIEWAGPGQPVMMSGPAVRVYEGQVRL